MEYVSLKEAKEIFGNNFIGVEALTAIAGNMDFLDLTIIRHQIPEINYSREKLQALASSHLLFLCVPFNKKGGKFTLIDLRSFFGTDPSKKEPCFYDQDWYINEKFSNNSSLELKWYLISKNILDDSRGKMVEEIKINNPIELPSALLCCLVFFAYYYYSGEILWKHDFIWCKEEDSNGDRIYVGRYLDIQGIAKNGFSIHRHLKIRKNYGFIDIKS